jgi:hypothetical protein
VSERAPSAVGSSRFDQPAIALGLVILVGLGTRALVTLLPDLVVGDDGAYYLIQVRAILRHGRLAVPDFPLLFYFQAAVALLLSLVMETRAAIVTVVRWTDTIIPVLLAVPVYQFARAFARVRGSSLAPTLAVVFVGLIAVASGNALEMAGGTVKNAAALPFSFLFTYYLYRSMRDGERGATVLAVLCFVVSSLTHIGGLALNATVAVLVAALGLPVTATRRRLLRPALALLACLVGAVVLVRLIDPERAARLLGVIAHPGRFFAGSLVSQWLRGVPHPPVDAVVTSEEVWLGNALGLVGLYVLWRHRATMDPATRVVLGATTLTALAFASPLLRPDLLERLAMISFVPGLVPLVYLVSREPLGSLLAAPITVLVMLNGALVVKTRYLTTLVRPAYDELVRMKAALPPGKTIVISPPGLDWWVVWTMDTHFSNLVGRALAGREAYDAVLLLDEIRAGAFGRATLTPLRDADLLRTESLTTLSEGEYFRLSLVGQRAGRPPP